MKASVPSFAFVSLALAMSSATLACAPTEEPAEAVQPSAVEAAAQPRGALRPVPGPVRLRGTCTAGNTTQPFEAEAGGETQSVGIGMSGMDWSSVEIALGEGPNHAVTMRTVQRRLSTIEDVERKKVSKDRMALGETIAIEDPDLVPSGPTACSGTLVRQPTIALVATSEDAVPLGSLDAPRLDIDVPLPNWRTCGVALRLAGAVPAGALEALRGSLDVDASEGRVTTTYEGGIAIVFRMPEANDWDVFLRIESRDHTTTLAERVRAVLGVEGTKGLGELVGVACPKE